MREILRAAFVIGRRDYLATVMSKTFLFFLLGPLFPIGLGMLFGGVGQELASQDERQVLAVIADEADFEALESARARLVPLAGHHPFIELERVEAEADVDAQIDALLERQDEPVLGVMDGGLTAPRFTGAIGENAFAIQQLATFIDNARRDLDADGPPTGPPLAFQQLESSASEVVFTRTLTARAGQLALFFLTILLAGMLLSQMLEEKSNKAIEVLASSVDVDAIFIGKLFAMLCISLTGIIVWLSAAIAAFIAFAPQGLASVPPPPAVGWPLFFFFALVYFAMSYLLIGAAFLGIGAQAATVREVQTLSMPITMLQVVIFLGASLGVGDPGGREAIAAALFPLTSPFAMIARAAEEPALWTHALALIWQLLWVALILKVAAKLFRKSVLKSGKPFRWPWAKKKASV
ncbi:ABC transporter permease [Sphingomicrobium sediminis]|uniref:ABC transporter permease n=1 Tax=Sphingomicrobium sediminis TaxID=2950949 RepID=A0A9X2EK69_9SPHN|nr:ABC transporter permease [Sphingomicrobium sediminis]MCM8558346.1 ABC transporter permease [Sphingomicrobium sediminis]